MNAVQVSALSYLSAQAAQETVSITHEETVVIGRSLTPRARKVKNGTRMTYSGSEVSQVGSQVPGSPMPNSVPAIAILEPPEPIDARTFIVGMRKADRQTAIKLIWAYTGSYDLAGNFGTQELTARTQANRELSSRPLLGMTGKDLSNAFRSVEGFVAGMPDNREKTRANLLGQAEKAVEERVEWQKTYHDESRSWEERLQAKGLFDIAGERLERIREDLNSL